MKNRLLRKINEKIHNYISSSVWENMTIQQRMFHVIAIIGTVVALLSLIETLAVADSILLVIVLLVLFFLFVGTLWIGIYNRRIDGAAILLGIFLNFIVCPALFIYQGGAQSGAPMWLILGFIYCFIMFSKWRLVAFVVATSIVDIVLYMIGYIAPDFYQNTMSVESLHLDSMYSVLAVGLTGGIMLLVETRLYANEQKLSQERNEELEKTVRSRNNLFSGLSHEIRTPINTITGLSELIERQNPSEEILRYADEIKNSSELLLSLVNDIMDFSEMEMNRMEIRNKAYGTRALFEEIYNMIYTEAKKNFLDFQVLLDPQIPSYLNGDTGRLKQIIVNLLNNSIQYTKDGYVRLIVSGDKLEDGKFSLRLEVSDSGTGIKKEEIGFIYDNLRGFESNRHSREIGAGLGLSIVQGIAKLMGGSVHVDSIYTKGTTFTIVVPQEVVDYAPVGNVFFGDDEMRKRYKYHHKFEAPEVKLLIVDDNHMNTVVTSRLLANTRIQVYSAESAKECMEILSRRQFNVILMSYRLPDVSGFDLLFDIRHQENGLNRETPVIAMTANAQETTESSNNHNDNFDSYLEKPIRSEDLENEIYRLIPKELITYHEDVFENAFDENGRTLRKKKKVCITTDCVSDIPAELVKQFDIRVQNLYIRTPNGRFLDTIEIDSDNMSQYLMENIENVTADSCSVEEFVSFFAQNLEEADDVIHISMASGAGRTYSRAIDAAAGFDHVHVFDSEQLSCGEALIVLEAARLADLGKTSDEILRALTKIKQRVNCGFLAPNVEIFHRRGYVKKPYAVITRILRMHPKLSMRRRTIMLSGLVIGEGEHLWRKYVASRVRNEHRIDHRVAVVTFANCSARQRGAILDELSSHIDFDQLIVSKSSVSSACNSGVGTFGISFFELER